MKKYENKSGYSVILALLMVGFMLVLTAGVFSLVLRESKDTKAMESYLKSYAGAEGAVELGMLKSKNYSYSINYSIPHNVNRESIMLAHDPLTIGNFHKAKDLLMSYNIDSISNDISKDLSSGEFDIIPLFFYDVNGNLRKINNISLSSASSDLVWNIVGKEYGISGIGNFRNNTNGNLKVLSGVDVSFSQREVGDFLSSSDSNYLILHNVSNNSVNYNLKSLNSGEYFTNFDTNIVGSAEIGGFKQNIRVNIKSSEYLNLLKYSIFSN